MDEFLKMDIFFFVTTLAVVALTIGAGIVLWRVARVLKHVEHISQRASEESDLIQQDLAEMRGDIKRGKSRLNRLSNFLRKVQRAYQKINYLIELSWQKRSSQRK